MKRIISILVTFAMMLSMFLAIIPVGAAAEDANEPYLTVDSAVVSIYESLIINAGSENASGKDWIALVPAGSSSYTAWVYLKDVTENFDLFSNAAVQNADKITSGKASLYLIPNDEGIGEYLNGNKTPLAKVDVFIYDDKISDVAGFNGMVDTGAYILDADITLPADFVGRTFKGTLDGTGKTITLSGKTGVFDTLDGATVENLNIAGTVVADGDMGALAKKVAGKTTVKNVFNKANVTAAGKAAGLIADGTSGKPTLTLIDCVNTGIINGTTYAGGLVGFIKGTVVLDGCESGIKDSEDVFVEGVKGVGGLIGESWGSCTINNSTNYGNMKFKGDNNWECSVGGLLGIFGNGTVEGVKSIFKAKNTANYGDSESPADWFQGLGGMVGNAKWVSSTEMYFEDCANYGSCIGNSANRAGFLGYSDNIAKISFIRCENHGHIESNGNNGGFLGQTKVEKTAIFEDCVNYGTIISYGNHAGGFAPWNGGGNAVATFDRCINQGLIEARNEGKAASAFVTDRPWTITFNDCANFGEIKTPGTALGFAYNVTKVTLNRCFNVGPYTGGGAKYEFASKEVTLNDCVVTDFHDDLIAAAKTLKIAPEYADPSDWAGVVEAFAAATEAYKGTDDAAKAAALAAVKKSITMLETYLLVDKLAATLDGEIKINASSTNAGGTDWIGIAPVGATAASYWVYLNTIPADFNILSWDDSVGAVAAEKTSGYYNIYLVPDDMDLADAIAQEAYLDIIENVFLSDKVIANVDDFLAMEADGVYALDADITLPADWVAKDFSGAIEGRGHTITLTGTEGLFANLAGATLKDFTLAGDVVTTSGVAKTATGNVTIADVTVALKGINFTSAFIGLCRDAASNLMFENCTNLSPLSANTADDSGAILGVGECNTAYFKNCTNLADVTNAHSDGIAGGILGRGNFNLVTFDRCANGAEDVDVTISGAMAVGGLAGDILGSIVIRHSVNYGYTKANGNWTGGICGGIGVVANWGTKKTPDKLVVDGFINYGPIDANNSSEGCAGLTYAKPGQDFEGKWITYDIRNVTNYADVKKGGSNVAGILSTYWSTNHKNSNAYFENCINFGDISSSGNNGGIMGQYAFENGTITFKNCANYGDVTSTGNVAGGISPWQQNGTYIFDGCVNYGTITANAEGKAAAGIAGQVHAGATFTNCENYGLIIAKKGLAAGINAWGTADIPFNGCANYAALDGNTVAQIAEAGAFTDCYDEGLTYAPIEIDSQEDFANIKTGGNYILVDDVVLGEDYAAVALGNSIYGTTFDGNGYTIHLKGTKCGIFTTLGNVTISNLTVIGDVAFEGSNGVIAKSIGKSIANVCFENVVVDVDVFATGEAAGFVHRVDSAADDYQVVSFSNCEFNGNIDSNGNSAGFVATGYFEGLMSFDMCTVGNSDVATHINAKSRVGAFIGEFWGTEKGGDALVTLNGCANYADLTAVEGTNAEGCVGAIAGRLCGVDVDATLFENHGEVKSHRTTSWYQGVGGLLGEVNNNSTATLSAVVNYGDVYAARSGVGGLVGAVTNNSYLTINDAINYGQVVSGSGWNYGAGGAVGVVAYKGGDKVANNALNTVTLNGVTNYGDISASNANCGGMVGMTESKGNVGRIEAIACVNHGNVYTDGGNNVAGIFGQMACTELVAVECENYGNIYSSKNGSGGIAAYSMDTPNVMEFINCVNYGNVTNAGGDAAAITADFDSKAGVVEGCENYGVIDGGARSGMIAGRIYGGTYTVKDNVNKGLIIKNKTAALLYPKNTDGAKVTEENNVNEGAIVVAPEYVAVAKTLGTYTSEDWAAIVAAFAAAEELLVPVEGEPEVIKLNELTYRALKYKRGIEVDTSTGLVTSEMTPNGIYDAFFDKAYVEVSEDTLKVDYKDDASGVDGNFYIADKTVPLTEDTYYVYYVNAKTNNTGKYGGIAFAAVNDSPYALFGALNNGSDDDKALGEFRAIVGSYTVGLFGDPQGTRMFLKQDLTEDGFGQYKFVYDGLTVKMFTMSGGEWTPIVFDGHDTVQLPEGAYITFGVFNRDGSKSSKRTASINKPVVVEAAPLGTVEEGLAIINEVLGNVIDRTEEETIRREILLAAAGKDSSDFSNFDAIIEALAALEAATTVEEYYVALEALKEENAALLYTAKLDYQLGYVAALNYKDWVDYSWENLMDVYEEVLGMELNTQDDVDLATAMLIEAVEGLTPTAEIWGLAAPVIEEALAINEDDVVASTWPEFAAAREAAVEAFNGTNYEALNSSLNALRAASEKLVFVRELKDLIAELSAIDPADYSSISYAPVGAAIAVGKAAITSVIESVIDDAVAGLRAAKEGLVNVSELAGMIAQLEKTDFSGYTPESVADVTKAITFAKLVVVSAESAEDVAYAIEVIKEARSNLKDVVVINTKGLEALIAQVEGYTASDYTPDSWDVVKAALAMAKVAVHASTQAEVTVAQKNLQDAVNALEAVAILNYNEIKSLIAEAKALVPADYTAETWDVLVAALDEAKDAVFFATTQAELNAAAEELLAAIDALVDAPAAVVADTSAINAEIEKASEYIFGEYTVESWNAFYEALSIAKIAAISNSQEQIDAATAALKTAMAALTVKPAPTEPAPVEPKPASGCGGSVVATLAVVAVVATLGTAVLRKKED